MTLCGEQALESALRKGLTTIEQIQAELPELQSLAPVQRGVTHPSCS